MWWKITDEKADRKLQFLTNKCLRLYLRSLLISHSCTKYVIVLNILLYLGAVVYPEISPGISVDCTSTNKKFVKVSLKHCPLKPFGCILRPCFLCVSEPTLNYLSNEGPYDYIWKNWLYVHFSFGLQDTSGLWHLKKCCHKKIFVQKLFPS